MSTNDATSRNCNKDSDFNTDICHENALLVSLTNSGNTPHFENALLALVTPPAGVGSGRDSEVFPLFPRIAAGLVGQREPYIKFG